jgi:hypothetical protein
MVRWAWWAPSGSTRADWLRGRPAPRATVGGCPGASRLRRVPGDFPAPGVWPFQPPSCPPLTAGTLQRAHLPVDARRVFYVSSSYLLVR